MARSFESPVPEEPVPDGPSSEGLLPEGLPLEGQLPEGLPPDQLGTGEDDAAAGMAGGMSWRWELDFAALTDAATGPAPWLRSDDSSVPAGSGDKGERGSAGTATTATEDSVIADPELEQAAYLEALGAGRVGTMPVGVVAGRVAESLPTGPGLAGWLALAPAADMEDGALAGVAASFRRLASWAAAGELAAVAQIASRSAGADRRATVDAAGRPDQVTGDATGQVALALTLSPDGAAGWTDLAVTLTWRLAATGAALAAGEIDLARAKLIARLTAPLSDEKARQVEQALLGRAGWLTLGQLHAALRRAVLKADPQGADKRREQAERNAKVVLYPEDEGTASLAGYCLPGVEAAAAMARVTALAKALQAAGAGGKIDLVRAQVFLGLLLGTLPYIPPAPGAPPDQPPGDDDPPGTDQPPRSDTPDELPEPADAPPPGEPDGDPLPGGPDGDPPPGGPKRSWPGVLPWLPAGPDRLGGVLPLAGAGAAGLLSLTVPLGTLAGVSAAPGQLSRLGVISAAQARQLAEVAAGFPATRWEVIVTTPGGQAVAVTAVPRSRSPGRGGSPCRGGAAAHGNVGLVGKVRVIIRADQLEPGPGQELGCEPGLVTHGLAAPGPAPPASLLTNSRLADIAARAVAAAARAWTAAAERRRRDERAGGCAHALASPAYRPPSRIAALVTARDQTCRFGPCGRPASQCDLDHDVPYDQGGLTCPCNTGAKCRRHHQLKQHPRWTVTQPEPGTFCWTTSAGRTYTTGPDCYVT